MAEIPIVGRPRGRAPRFPEVALAEIEKGALESIVGAVTAAVTRNVVQNVVNNVVARMKDRCAFVGHGGACRVTRVVHNSGSHDFLEPMALVKGPADPSTRVDPPSNGRASLPEVPE
jgi:hypothetical protein